MLTQGVRGPPASRWGTRVGIVGAGAAGIVAAYELFRAGLDPVIFEATDRIGGRNYSEPFGGKAGANAAIAELGAMRVPPSCKVFYYYAGLLGMKFSTFPDPGKVPTTLYYENDCYQWAPGRPAPGPFAQIAADVLHRGLSVALVDAGSGRPSSEPGITDLAGERASFGDVVHKVQSLLGLADAEAVAMHDLPAHVGEEITADVLYGPRCVAWEQAENRLHTQKALMALVIR